VRSSAQLPAFPRVLKFAEAVSLCLSQQIRQGLREVARYGLALVQTPRDLPIHMGDVNTKRLFPAHGSPKYANNDPEVRQQSRSWRNSAKRSVLRLIS